MAQRYFNIVLIICLLFFSCQLPNSKKPDGNNQLYIVTTTGMIADGIKNITGDKARVESLMGSGIDPHYYKATQSDLKKLKDADIVIYNGLLLEGKMVDIFETMAKSKTVIPVTGDLDKSSIRMDPRNPGIPDPHVWFDVSLWSSCLAYATEFIINDDPENEEFYRMRLAIYRDELERLHAFVKEQISSIPAKQRVLITTHDAFGYFGKAYDMEVKGLQGISTVAEIGIRDIKEMTERVIEQNIKAVFVENSVSDKSISAVMKACREKDHELKLGGVLFADAMGQESSVEGTYIGMVTSNVNKIVNALK